MSALPKALDSYREHRERRLSERRQQREAVREDMAGLRLRAAGTERERAPGIAPPPGTPKAPLTSDRSLRALLSSVRNAVPLQSV